MSTVIQAVFEDGVIRPSEPVDLSDGEEVEIIVLRREVDAQKRSRQILTEIANLPIEGNEDEFSGEQHDSVLYPAA